MSNRTGASLGAPRVVQDLVRDFRSELANLKGRGYNEHSLRDEFLNPLFRALDWDVGNLGLGGRPRKPESEKDVHIEPPVAVAGMQKAADYAFRIGGQRVFLLEAKKPQVNIRENKNPAFQIRRYGYNDGLAVCCLSDFEDLALYDCTRQPRSSSPATAGRLRIWNFEEYCDRWDEISSLLSRDAVLAGSLERILGRSAILRTGTPVGTAFLKDLEEWRTLLASDVALRNASLTPREVNFVVQMTMDRVLFLRICEARGIDHDGALREAGMGSGAHARLQALYRVAEEKYNSGLFHFKREANRTSAIDEITPSIEIGDQALHALIDELTYEDCPYDFSVLPVDILGQAYEQFLGKVITLDDQRAVTVEYKPEVRKSGGVYYTPKWVVDYVVRQTLGLELAGKTPKQAADIKVLDPACGSGSFLLGAYQYLLDWHLDWYTAHTPEKHPKDVRQTPGGDWRLTTRKRKEILRNSIFGVDIDEQAVEVAKLSLSIRVLEGENSETIGQTMSFLVERALPELERNIRCGNSLVGTDIYQAQLDLEGIESYRVNAFDWAAEFPEVMGRVPAGFDVVIGNPPYFNVDDTWGRMDPRRLYLKEHYPQVYTDKTDIAYYFLYRGVQLSRSRLGLIVSRAFLEAFKAENLRASLSAAAEVEEIIDFKDYPVFPGVGIATAIVSFRVGKRERRNPAVYRLAPAHFSPIAFIAREDTLPSEMVDNSRITSAPWIFTSSENNRLIELIDGAGVPLDQCVTLGQGMQTGANGVFAGMGEQELDAMAVPSSARFRRARNSDIHSFALDRHDRYVLYLEDYSSFDQLPPAVQDYLQHNRDALEKRAAHQRGDCEWWKFTWPLHKHSLRTPRIFTPYLAQHNRFALDAGCEFLGLTDTTVLYLEREIPEDPLFVLALLNSSVLTFRFRFMAKDKGNGVLEYFWNNLRSLPVRRIDMDDREQRDAHDEIVMLARRATAQAEASRQARLPVDKEQAALALSATREQLDRAVAELYGLDEDALGAINRQLGRCAQQ